MQFLCLMKTSLAVPFMNITVGLIFPFLCSCITILSTSLLFLSESISEALSSITTPNLCEFL